MAARRYQRGWATASLRVMLASSLFMKMSRPQMPGKPEPPGSENDDSGSQVCPVDRGQFVPAEDGSLYCQICALPIEDIPDVMGS